MKLYVFPGVIEKEILDIGSHQIPYMRTNDFSLIVKECERLLLSFIGCKEGRSIIYTASGTGAMDAVVTNYVATKKKAFIISGGTFGKRWHDLCEYYECVNVVYEVSFAKDVNYIDLENRIAEERPDVFLCQHHETSTGQLFDIKRIASICRKFGISLVVDVISSFLADPFDMDELGVDICLTSSQKGLNIPPGLSILFFSKRLMEYSYFLHKSFYFDFDENLKNLLRGQTPYSPATSLFLQLHERLKRIACIGVSHVIEDVRKKAIYFRKLCAENNWIIPAENPSNCITGFFVNNNGDKVFELLLKQNIFIMPGAIKSFFRVSHLGVQSNTDLDDLVSAIKKIENQ